MSKWDDVINEGFKDESLRMIARFEATYVGNCAGGRPSDNASLAVSYVKRALERGESSPLASPTAIKMFEDWLFAGSH